MRPLYRVLRAPASDGIFSKDDGRRSRPPPCFGRVTNQNSTPFTIRVPCPRPRETLDEARHFRNWFKALVIGLLEIPITPPKGWSNSRIRNIAPETAKAERSNAITAVGLGGASTLKPRKMLGARCAGRPTSPGHIWCTASLTAS